MTVEATFYNPDPIKYGHFDYGLIFRYSPNDESLLVFQVTNRREYGKRGEWSLIHDPHTTREGSNQIAYGYTDAVNIVPGEPNHLKVTVVNDQIVKLSINGISVHDAVSYQFPQNQYYDISDGPSYGYVGTMTGFYDWVRTKGVTVYYEGFKATKGSPLP